MKAAAVLLSVALVAPAFADEVILNNGAAFTGLVREERDRIVVEVDFGTMTFKRSDIRSIRKSDDPIREYEQRLKAATDVKGYYDLSVWCRDKGLTSRATELLKKVIFLDPDHEEARKALGYEKVDGRWLEGEDLKIARGYVKHGGRWLKKDTAERFQEQDKLHQIESERLASAERIARLQADVERARIALQRERVELERERASYLPWWAPGFVIGGARSPSPGIPAVPCAGCGVAPCRCATPRPAVTQLPPLPQRLPPPPPLPAPITGRP